MSIRDGFLPEYICMKCAKEWTFNRKIGHTSLNFMTSLSLKMVWKRSIANILNVQHKLH